MEGGTKMVVKRDGRHEPFDRDKLRRSLRTACRKRPVSADDVARIVERVTSALEARPGPEVDSAHIGELLMAELRRVDEVAYARFASVYRQFSSLQDFVDLAEAVAPAEDDP